MEESKELGVALLVASEGLREIFPTTMMNGREVRVCVECGYVLVGGECYNSACSESSESAGKGIWYCR